MNVKRTITVATVTAVAAIASAGLSSSPAMATHAPAMKTTISNGPTPNVLTWRECWAGVYANYREDGYSIQTSATAADLACGASQDKY